MKLVFGSWFRIPKKIFKELGEAKALESHSNRTPYSVVFLNEEEEPFAFVEINNEFLQIVFLDSLKRVELSFTFNEVKKGTLFLKKVQNWHMYRNPMKRVSPLQ